MAEDLATLVAQSRAIDVIEYDTGRIGLVFTDGQHFAVGSSSVPGRIVRVQGTEVGGHGKCTLVTVTLD